DRGGAPRDRSRGAAVRRARRDGRRGGRAPLPRDPPAAHLRGHQRDPAHDHRPRARQAGAAGMTSAPPGFPDAVNLRDYFLFDRLGEGRGDHVAIRFGDRAWRYRDVADRSRALARALVAHGLRPEQRVYIVLPDVPPFAWGIFATLAAGGVLTMGNPVAPADDLAYVLDYVKAAVLITTPEVAEALAPRLAALPQLTGVLLAPSAATGEDPEATATPPPAVAALAGAGRWVASLDVAIAAADPAIALPAIRRDDPAIWLFTSGSTGRPKAAMHSHRDFA